MSVMTGTTTTMVEGIGDEVIYFFGFSLLLVLLVLAWSSTSVTDNGMIRAAVFGIDSRRRSSQDQRNTTVTNSGLNNNSDSITTAPAPASTSNGEHEEASNEEGKAEGINTAAAKEDRSKTSADRLGDEQRSAETDSNQSENVENVEPEDVIEGQITVRLKFLNETQKLVDARLADQLGHFKRRHFAEELESNKIVRLIFNGQLLQRDHETLSNHGLFDNCVVHCHISSSSSNSSNAAASPAPPSSRPSFSASPQVELDLSRLMLPLFGLILGLIWCCRIQYRQYFNATSTFALLCITGLFVVSVVAICLPTRTARRH